MAARSARLAALLIVVTTTTSVHAVALSQNDLRLATVTVLASSSTVESNEVRLGVYPPAGIMPVRNAEDDPTKRVAPVRSHYTCTRGRDSVAACNDDSSILNGSFSWVLPDTVGRQKDAAIGVFPEIAARGAGVRFAQQGISSTFRHGEFAGKTIQEVAAGLRSGAISPNQLPIQMLTRNGIEYTLNNRSLMSLRQAGLNPTVITNVTGNAFFEGQITQRLLEIGDVAADFLPFIRP